MYQYKLIKAWDYDMEKNVNELAKDGWRVHSITLENSLYSVFLERKRSLGNLE